MLIGVVSDIHCNAAALLRAMELIGEVDEWVCLGDSIREYRFSNEVVSILRSVGCITLQGNHEEVFYSSAGATSRSSAGGDPELLEWLAQQPSRRMLRREGKEILLVHTTPWPSGGAYVCAHDRDFHRFGETTADIVLYGHTHEPVVARAGRVLVVNPGSTGEARMRHDRLELSCAVLDVGNLDARIIPFALDEC
jgi:putative phosphoesterase